MQNVLIVEDDLEQLNILSHMIAYNYPEWTVSVANSYDDAVRHISESVDRHQAFTLFLFDVQLSSDKDDRGGFKLGDYLRSIEQYYSTPVLFLTSVPDDNHQALHTVHYYDYIAKPYTESDILHRLQIMLARNILNADSFFVTDIDSVKHRVFPKDITFINVKGRRLHIHQKNYEIITRNYTMTSILDYVTPYCIQCHNSYIINKDYLTNFDPVNKCILVDKHTLIETIYTYYFFNNFVGRKTLSYLIPKSH